MSAKAKLRVLVLGWYGHGNLGDEAFRASFEALWPQHELVFRDHVPLDLSPFSACFVGGGSFLDADFPGLARLHLPTAFVGVGVGRKISTGFRRLLAESKAILVRDAESLARLPADLDRSKVMFVSDLFYARSRDTIPRWRGQESNLVSVFLSEHFVPRGPRPDWFSEGWNRFALNLAAALDVLSERGMKILFVPFSTSPAHDDRRPAAEVSSRKINAAKSTWEYPHAVTEDGVLDIIASSRLVISVRLHGMIFASSVGCPFVAICGHDKSHAIASSMQWPYPVDLYHFRWRRIVATMDEAMNQKPDVLLPHTMEAFQKWLVASEFVNARLLP